MIANELINHSVPFLRPTDNVKKAIELMMDNHLTQMVVAKNDSYIGLLSLDFLEDSIDLKTKIEDILPQYGNIFAKNNQHSLEVLSLMQLHNLKVVAVLNEQNEFKGAITISDLLSQFSKSLGIDEIGAIIVLAINSLDFSMAEIARLIESNNVKIISSYYATSVEEYGFRNTLTLKLNSKNIDSVLATLSRFEYDVLATFANAPINSPEKENYDMLIKYLEI
jgi:acetoin utilization protein AcuB